MEYETKLKQERIMGLSGIVENAPYRLASDYGLQVVGESSSHSTENSNSASSSSCHSSSNCQSSCKCSGIEYKGFKSDHYQTVGLLEEELSQRLLEDTELGGWCIALCSSKGSQE